MRIEIQESSYNTPFFAKVCFDGELHQYTQTEMRRKFLEFGDKVIKQMDSVKIIET